MCSCLFVVLTCEHQDVFSLFRGTKALKYQARNILLHASRPDPRHSSFAHHFAHAFALAFALGAFAFEYPVIGYTSCRDFTNLSHHCIGIGMLQKPIEGLFATPTTCCVLTVLQPERGKSACVLANAGLGTVVNSAE